MVILDCEDLTRKSRNSWRHQMIFLEGASLRRIFFTNECHFSKRVSNLNLVTRIQIPSPSPPLPAPNTHWLGLVIFLLLGDLGDGYCRVCLRCHGDRASIQLITTVTSPVSTEAYWRVADESSLYLWNWSSERFYFLLKNNFSCTNQHMEGAW